MNEICFKFVIANWMKLTDQLLCIIKRFLFCLHSFCWFRMTATQATKPSIPAVETQNTPSPAQHYTTSSTLQTIKPEGPHPLTGYNSNSNRLSPVLQTVETIWLLTCLGTTISASARALNCSVLTNVKSVWFQSVPANSISIISVDNELNISSISILRYAKVFVSDLITTCRLRQT